MSKLETLSRIIASHETYWAALGSQHTASDWPELAAFLQDEWDPWFTRWQDVEPRLQRENSPLLTTLVKEASQGLSELRSVARYEYGIPVPSIGSTGPRRPEQLVEAAQDRAGAISLIGWTWNPLAQKTSSDRRRNPGGWRGTGATKKPAPRVNTSSDHRTQPGGWQGSTTSAVPELSQNTLLQHPSFLSPAIQALQQQESAAPPYQAPQDGDDGYDGGDDEYDGGDDGYDGGDDGYDGDDGDDGYGGYGGDDDSWNPLARGASWYQGPTPAQPGMPGMPGMMGASPSTANYANLQALAVQRAQYANQRYGDGRDVLGGWLSDAWDSASGFVKDHAGDIKSLAQKAGSYVGGDIGKDLAGKAVDAWLGDPNAKKAVAAAAAHPVTANLMANVGALVGRSVIAKQMDVAVQQAANGNASAKVALAKVATAAMDPNAHPDVAYAAKVADTAAARMKEIQGNPLALMASWQ